MRFRGLMVAALAATLVAAGSGSAFADGHHGGFEDLGNAQWAAGAINTLAAQGLIQGLTPTQFGPQDPVTIGQLAAILLRYQGQAQAGTSFGTQVAQAESDGYLSGLGGSAGSSEDATRAQAMTMIMDALGVSTQNAQYGTLGQFRDWHGVPAWARGSMGLAVQSGILQGSGGDLMPFGLLTRAQLAVILLRVEADLAQLLATSGTYGHAGALTGTVTQIGNGTITVAATPGVQSGQGDDQGEDGGGNLPSGTYPVSPFVKVVIPGEGAHGSLSQVQVGDYVHIVVHPGGQVRMIIVLPQPVSGNGGASQGTPTNVAASEAPSGVALSWAPVSGASYYQVLVSSGGSYTQVPSANGGTPTATGTTVTGLTAGTTYTFEVEAITSTGTVSSASSPSASVEWGAKSGTSATVTVSTAGATSWLSIGIPYDKTLSTAGLDTYLGDYTLVDSGTGQELAVAGVSANGSTLTITSGGYPSSYFTSANQAVRVTTTKSVVDDSAGAPTTPIDATGGIGAAAPLNLNATEGASGISLTWTPVSGATYYDVLVLTGGSGVYAPVASAAGGTPTASSTTVTGLSAGTTYNFEVESVGASGQVSAPSSPSAAVEWGAKPSATAGIAVNQAGSSLQSFTITITYDKSLSSTGLDTNLGDYRILDATTGQYLTAASVSVVGNTFVIETSLYPTMALTGTMEITTQKSVVNDSAGAPTTPISATGTL